MVTLFLIYKMFFRISVFIEVKFADKIELIRYFSQTVFSYFFCNLFNNFYKFLDTYKGDFDIIGIMSTFAAQNRFGIIIVLICALFNRLLVDRKGVMLLLIALLINMILFVFGL